MNAELTIILQSVAFYRLVWTQGRAQDYSKLIVGGVMRGTLSLLVCKKGGFLAIKFWREF